jgi:hypothetical protein
MSLLVTARDVAEGRFEKAGRDEARRVEGQRHHEQLRLDWATAVVVHPRLAPIDLRLVRRPRQRHVGLARALAHLVRVFLDLRVALPNLPRSARKRSKIRWAVWRRLTGALRSASRIWPLHGRNGHSCGRGRGVGWRFPGGMPSAIIIWMIVRCRPLLRAIARTERPSS